MRLSAARSGGAAICGVASSKWSSGHRGSTEAFDTRTVLTPAAEALLAALPPLVQLYGAATQALDHAEAIRLSIRLIDRE